MSAQLMVDCPYCDLDSPDHVVPENCRHCKGTRKTPSSSARILKQLRLSRVRFLGPNRKFIR